jgi:hypothetical protein
MKSSKEDYDDLRRPHLEKAGIHHTAVQIILDLERTQDHAVIGFIAQLEKTAAWKGRTVTIAKTGLTLEHDGSVWRIQKPATIS